MTGSDKIRPGWMLFRLTPLFLAVSGFALVLSCSASNQSAVAPQPAPPGWSELNLEHGGVQRWFRVYRPSDLPEKAAVVTLLHGGTQSMRKIFRPRSGGTQEWRQVADSEKFLLLVPNGTNPDTGDAFGDKQHWNDIRNAARVNNPDVDDVGFMRELFQWVRSRYSVDPKRFYVTGASNGGMMTYRLLMEMSDQIAAGAAFIANLPMDGRRLRDPARAVPLMICNGTADPLVHWDGGEIPRGRGNLRSAEQTVAWWVRANHASEKLAASEDLADLDPSDGCRLYRTTYPPLPGGAEVVFIRMQGGGHTLPSNKHTLPDYRWVGRLFGPVCRDAEGARLAWDFLKQHQMQDGKPPQ